MTIFKHEIKSNIKIFLIWVLTIGSMNFVMMLFFPSMKEQMIGMENMFADMGNLSAAFGMDKISVGSPLGYYGTQVGMILSLGGAMFAALVGGAMLCKEEGNHTAEFLFTQPVSRAGYIFSKAFATVTLIVFFDIFCFLAGYSSFLFIGEQPDVQLLLLYHLAQLLMHIQIGLMCFGISAFMTKNNVGVGLGISILLYFIQIFYNISEKADFLKYVTPYCYSDAAEIFSSESLDLKLMVVGGLTLVIFFVGGLIKYSKKDLRA